MKKRLIALLAMAMPIFAIGVTRGSGQTPSPTIKSTPAEETLIATAKALQTEQKSLDTLQQQAKVTLDASQKQLQEAFAAKQKALEDDLKADKKYGPRMKELDTIQAQLKDLTGSAQNAFIKSAGPIAQKVASDKALIEGLVPVVRKENNLPDSAQFDVVTQAWK